MSSTVANYYNDSSTHDWYSTLWGVGNVHFCHFGEAHIDELVANIKKHGTSPFDSDTVSYCYSKLAEESSSRLCERGGIDHKSVVLDLGCGYGKSAMHLLAWKQCKLIVGLDLSELHIQKAREMALKMSEAQRLKFIQGSFVQFPPEITTRNEHGYYTHIWSEAALSHCHPQLDEIVKQCKRVLHPVHGKLVINDVVANKPPNQETLRYVYQRMHYDHLLSTKELLSVLARNGFKVLYFEDLSKHLWASYKLLIHNAKKYEQDGRYRDLILKYSKTCESIERDEFCMINIVAQIDPKIKSKM